MTEENTHYRESWKSLSYEELKRKKTIQALNDKLRKTLPRTQDMIIVMGALKDEDPELQMKVYRTAQAFDDFTERNDPYGEHDWAAFEVDGRKFNFKIDYYDTDLRFASPDPTDPKVTRRVMSLFAAEDY